MRSKGIQLDKFTHGHYPDPLVAAGLIRVHIRRNDRWLACAPSFGNEHHLTGFFK